MDKKNFSTWELNYTAEMNKNLFTTSVILTLYTVIVFMNGTLHGMSLLPKQTPPVTEAITIQTEQTESVESTTTQTTTTTTAVSKPDLGMSTEDINLIALVTMAEAEGESEMGKRLVIDTVLNRMDHPFWPNTASGVIYQKSQFTSMWNGRVDRCYVRDDIVQLVKEELQSRTNSECVFFRMGRYSDYGKPMFKEGCHYFSSYK